MLDLIDKSVLQFDDGFFYTKQGEEHRDSWEMWNSFRTLGEHHSQLSVALDVLYVYKFVKCSYFKFNGLGDKL